MGSEVIGKRVIGVIGCSLHWIVKPAKEGRFNSKEEKWAGLYIRNLHLVDIKVKKRNVSLVCSLTTLVYKKF